MSKQQFWNENADYIDSIMNKVNMLAEDTYIYILHLEQNRAWFSETAKDYFGIPGSYDICFSCCTMKMSCQESMP